MEHHHAHHQYNQPLTNLNRAFLIGITLNLLFVGVEFTTGFFLHSLALISDAGHNLSDVVSLVLALLAFKLMKVKPTANYTYGLKRSTILVSLLNALILLFVVIFIIWESIQKFQNPQPLDGLMVAWIAGVGVLINGFTAYSFLKDKERDINIKGTYLHMAADTLVSVGVLISGVVIYYTQWYVIDPILGILIAVAILYATWGLLSDSLRLALDGVPKGIDFNQTREFILSHEKRVVDVHHLHIWALSSSENALTAHLVVHSWNELEEIKQHIKHELEHLNIQHATLEFELLSNQPCESIID